jgi:hypothetical protein
MTDALRFATRGGTPGMSFLARQSTSMPGGTLSAATFWLVHPSS